MPRALFLLMAAATLFAAPPPSAKPAQSDAAIEANIRAKFAKSKINQEQFRVTVRSGIAYLEGKTDIPQRKGVATRLAKTGGAREVVNKIEVGEAARRKMTERLEKAREAKAKPAPPSSAKPAAHAKPNEPKAEAKPPEAAAAAEPDPPLRRMQIKR